MSEKYPPKLRDLFQEELQGEDISKVLSIAETIILETSPEQCKALEEATRQQSKSKLWFQYRAGKIIFALWQIFS